MAKTIFLSFFFVSQIAYAQLFQLPFNEEKEAKNYPVLESLLNDLDKLDLKGGFEAWQAAGEKVDMIVDVEADELAMDIPHDPNLVVVDVRRETEYADGHLKDAQNLPLHEMTDVAHLAQFDDSQNLYIHCAGGYRSMIFNSTLRARGYDNLIDVNGGFKAIKESEKFKITDYVCPSTLL